MTRTEPRTAFQPFKDLRQMLVPREFRIASPAWPPDLARRLATAIGNAARAAADSAEAARKAALTQRDAAAGQNQSSKSPDAGDALQKRLKFLAEVATGLWRMRRCMVAPGPGRLLDASPLETMRKPFRWLVSAWDALKENGVEIQDHTGDPDIPGQLLNRHFELAPDFKQSTIVDTIKPTVYLDGRIIQVGEVIIGTPASADSEAAASKQPPIPASPFKTGTGPLTT